MLQQTFRLFARTASWLMFVQIGYAQTQPLLQVGQAPVQATLVGTAETGDLIFRIRNAEQQIAPEKLLRWSTPRRSKVTSELVLSDGSQLMLAESWAGKSVLQISAKTVTATTKLLGKISFDRAKLKAVLFHAPSDLQQRTQLLTELTNEKQPTDRFVLANGDRLSGHCLEVGAKILFETAGATKPVELPLDENVIGIAFAPGAQHTQPGKNRVGLRDGSLLNVVSLVVDQTRLSLKLSCNLELSGAGLRDVVYLRSLTARVKYLSDLEPAAYRHVPYLEIPWPFQRDQNVLGGPLVVGGRIYPKGLGMHSAARLTYDLKNLRSTSPEELSRFVSQVALDDAAGKRGSVIFRVYLRADNDWQEAYTSPVMRGGDAPQQIDLELGAATQLALVTDYADRGDERDYANWLDARLE